MSIDKSTYEVVIGLEVHAQLSTASKLFSGDATRFGAAPNSHISPITLAHPGSLPKMNKKAIEYAVKMGLACQSKIEQKNYFARKNYFYADLPKGYQISQHTTPICVGGKVTIAIENGEKDIRLNRIHLEEDAGKSIHDIDAENTVIDLNRAGTPLIEIVTEPDLRSAEEAFNYLTEIRKLVRYLSICDGNMEEGSLRCDANISVRLKGDEKLGTKVEVKNLNSIRNLKRAIEFETDRLIQLHATGEKIVQETRSFDANNGTTFSIREKEDADDYRYFPDPDLTPFHITAEYIATVKESLPIFQKDRIKFYQKEWALSDYDAQQLTEEKQVADYFEAVVGTPTSSDKATLAKAAANWIMGPIKSWLNEKNLSIEAFPLPAKTIGSIITLIQEGKISFSTASTKLLNKLLEDPSASPENVAKAENWIQVSDSASIEPIIENVLTKLSDKVAEYHKGKKGLLSLFVGEVMKQSKGKADPKLTNQLLLEKLNSHK